jgi:hypothetical protein
MLPCLASLTEDKIIGMRIDFADTFDDHGLWVSRLFTITYTTENSFAVRTHQVEDIGILRMEIDCPQDAVMALATYSVYSNRASDEYKVYASKISHCYLRVRLLCGSDLLVPARWQGRTRRG